MAIKITDKPSGSVWTANAYTFARPPTAIAWGGSQNLFTVGACPQLLFKEVGSFEEIEDLGGGIAYFSNSGLEFVAYVGRNAEVERLAGITANAERKYFDPTSRNNGTLTEYNWLAPAVESSEIAGGSLHPDFQALLRGYNNHAQSNPAKTIRAAGWFTTSGVVRARPLTFLNTGNEVVFPRVCAVVCRADAGIIMSYGPNKTIGWMSTRVTLGSIRGGMFKAAESMLAEAPSKVKPYIISAHNEMLSQGQFDIEPKIGIVTSWVQPPGSPSTWEPVCQTSCAYDLPSVSWGSVASSTTDQLTMNLRQNSPTWASPHRIGPLFQFTPDNLPNSVLQGVAAWHRVAESGAVGGKMMPIEGGAAVAGGWAAFVRPLEWITNEFSALSSKVNQFGTHTEATAMQAGFNASLSEGEDPGPRLRYFCDANSLITGDLFDTYRRRVDALYKRAEAKVRSS